MIDDDERTTFFTATAANALIRSRSSSSVRCSVRVPPRNCSKRSHLLSKVEFHKSALLCPRAPCSSQEFPQLQELHHSSRSILAANAAKVACR